MSYVLRDCCDYVAADGSHRSEQIKPEDGPLRNRAARQAAEDDYQYFRAHRMESYRWRRYQQGEFGPELPGEWFYPLVLVHQFREGGRRRMGVSVSAGDIRDLFSP